MERIAYFGFLIILTTTVGCSCSKPKGVMQRDYLPPEAMGDFKVMPKDEKGQPYSLVRRLDLKDPIIDVIPFTKGYLRLNGQNPEPQTFPHHEPYLGHNYCFQISLNSAKESRADFHNYQFAVEPFAYEGAVPKPISPLKASQLDPENKSGLGLLYVNSSIFCTELYRTFDGGVTVYIHPTYELQLPVYDLVWATYPLSRLLYGYPPGIMYDLSIPRIWGVESEEWENYEKWRRYQEANNYEAFMKITTSSREKQKSAGD